MEWIAGLTAKAKRIILIGCGGDCQSPLGETTVGGLLNEDETRQLCACTAIRDSEILHGWDMDEVMTLPHYTFCDGRSMWVYVQTIRCIHGHDPLSKPIIFLGLDSPTGLVENSLWSNEQMETWLEELRRRQA